MFVTSLVDILQLLAFFAVVTVRRTAQNVNELLSPAPRILKFRHLIRKQFLSSGDYFYDS
jgi:hypothetical protein